MKSQPKVTTIIIHQDAKSHLDEALHSVLNQTLDSVETIVASSSSAKPAVGDSVELIYSKQSTYGELINLGIKQATGEYVAILDANDFIDSTLLGKLYRMAVTQRADIARSCFSYYYDDLTEKSPFYNKAMGGVWCEPMACLARDHDVRNWPYDKDNCNVVINPRVEGGRQVWPIFTVAPRINGIYRRQWLIDNEIVASNSNNSYCCNVGFWVSAVAATHAIVFSNEYGWHYRQESDNCTNITDINKEFLRTEAKIDTNNSSDIMALQAINVAKMDSYFKVLRKLRSSQRKEFLCAMSREFKQIRDNLRLNWWCVNETDTYMLNEIIDNPQLALRRFDAVDKAKISVVVPFYNVSKYIGKCLDSIVNQTMKDLEIILVNDESPDDSIMTALEYYKKDPRITILYQNNKGLSGARNTGLWYSHAPFVYFADSDDYLFPNTCEVLYDNLIKSGADLTVGAIENEYHADYNSMRAERLGCMLRYHGLQKLDNDVIYTNIAVWNKLFRRSVINKYGLHFPEGLWYEDTYFVLAYMMLSDTVYFVSDPVYMYVHRAGSITSTTRERYSYNRKGLDNMRVTEWLFNDYVKKYDLLPKYKSFMSQWIVSRCDCALMSAGPDCIPDVNQMFKYFILRHKDYLDKVDPSLVGTLSKGYASVLKQFMVDRKIPMTSEKNHRNFSSYAKTALARVPLAKPVFKKLKRAVGKH